MPTTPTPRRRSIDMPEVRSRQLALAAAHLGITSHQAIQSFITAGILSLAANDPLFATMLLRTSGVSWNDLISAEVATERS